MDAVLQDFDNWMNGSGPSTLLLALCANLLLAPMFALVHELGHAAVGLVHSNGPVIVSVGRRPSCWRTRVGRVQFELSPVVGRREPAGSVQMLSDPDSARAIVLLALAGPALHSLAAGVLLLAGVELHSAAVALTGGIALGNALLSLVPHGSGGRQSDGARMLDALGRLRG